MSKSQSIAGQALRAICNYSNRHVGKNCLAEDIRKDASRRGVPSFRDDRSWGPIFKEAEHLGAIKKIGYAPTVSSNGSPKVLWRMIGLKTVKRRRSAKNC